MAIAAILLHDGISLMTENPDELTSTRRTGHAGWWLTCYPTATSTNDIARDLPPWSAVMALRQTAGRGRLGRAFSSLDGGLWISAVLPAQGGPLRWNGFSLAVGRFLLSMLRQSGVTDARLRWPNDLMVGSKKLGGILIEQAAPEVLIVGLGLNLTNEPWLTDPTLEPIATRLAAHLPAVPDIWDAARLALDAIADAHHDMEVHGLGATIDALNQKWRAGSEVAIQPFDSEVVTGNFVGLDPTGNLRLLRSDGNLHIVEHQRVERLIET